MAQVVMYPGKAFSPPTTLTENIGSADTVIPVQDVSVLPAPPNYATIGSEGAGETIQYNAISGNSLSGCARGIEGEAQAWQSGEVIARNWTAKDHNDIIANISDAVVSIPVAITAHNADVTSHQDIRSAITSEIQRAQGAEGDEAKAREAADIVVRSAAEAYTDTVGETKVDKSSTLLLRLNNGNFEYSSDGEIWQPFSGDWGKTFAASLPASGWIGSGPYAQTVAVSGITAAMTTVCDLILPDDTDTAMAELDAWGAVSKIETVDGAVTATCFGSVPEIDLNIQMVVIG